MKQQQHEDECAHRERRARCAGDICFGVRFYPVRCCGSFEVAATVSRLRDTQHCACLAGQHASTRTNTNTQAPVLQAVSAAAAHKIVWPLWPRHTVQRHAILELVGPFSLGLAHVCVCVCVAAAAAVSWAVVCWLGVVLWWLLARQPTVPSAVPATHAVRLFLLLVDLCGCLSVIPAARNTKQRCEVLWWRQRSTVALLSGRGPEQQLNHRCVIWLVGAVKTVSLVVE